MKYASEFKEKLTAVIMYPDYERGHGVERYDVIQFENEQDAQWWIARNGHREYVLFIPSIVPVDVKVTLNI